MYQNSTRDLYALFEGIASNLRMPRRSYMGPAPRKGQNMSIPPAPLVTFLPLPSIEKEYAPKILKKDKQPGFLNAPVATLLAFPSIEDEYTPRAPIIPLKELYKPDKEDLEEDTTRRLAGALMALAIDPSVSDGEPQGAMDRYDWNAVKDSINKLEGVATNTDSLWLQNVPKIDNVAGLNSGNAVPSSERSLSPDEDFVTTSLRPITHVQPGVEVPAQVIRPSDGRRRNPGYRRGSGLTNVGQEPNRVWSSASPFRTRRPPSPPRRDPTNAPKSERIPPTKEGYLVLEEHPKSPKSAGSKAESTLPELKPEAATGTLKLSSEPPLQDRPGTSGNNIQDSKVAPEHPTDGQENHDRGRDNQQLSDRPSESPPDAGEADYHSDHEPRHLPPGATNQHSNTSSSPVDDVGSFITSISEDAVSINGHFCDVFEGMHSTAGKVALKRPRIGGTGDEEGTIRDDALENFYCNERSGDVPLAKPGAVVRRTQVF
ncbi:hypothetical protein FRC05_004750 [Tulasnella sp. 425]|nr:hypothetical protein FRC05_004750 [Tulasnella sp. 425]